MTDRIRYYRVHRDRAFWEPGKFGVSYGFHAAVKLGKAGPDAKKKAIEWNAKLDAARAARKAGEDETRRYGDFTLGAFYELFVSESESWDQMAPRTKEDYLRCWPLIEKRFGHTQIDAITSEESERFHVDIHPAHKPNAKRDPDRKLKLTWNTAHRTLKVWRALMNALVEYQQIPPPAPIGRVTNPAPPGRDAIWLHGEVMDLVKAAERLGLWGVAVAIRVAWDAMLSPVDVFALPIGGFRAAVEEVRTKRRKTQRKVYASVTGETVRAVSDYLARLEKAGVNTEAASPLVRDGRLKPYSGPHAKKYFERDFRRVREAAFPGDRRQLLDIRRSAITEGRMGGASLDDLGASAANNLGADELLQATYTHAASAKVRDARVAGREKMARSGTTDTSDSGTRNNPHDGA